MEYLSREKREHPGALRIMAGLIVIFAMTLLIIAAATDFLYAAIPNMISFSIAVLFVAFGLNSSFDLGQWGTAFACGAGALAVGFALFAFNVIGGGDAKLLAATALWAGWPGIFDLLIVMGLAGAVITIPMLVDKARVARLRVAARKALGPEIATIGLGRVIDINEERPTDAMIPYGIAIAVAAIATVFVGMRT
jgi:prepilin peptidase CpaA